ncbi:hypothetical protein L873DRAFT_1770849 [Choiromyces venosus 120613-1]|uniref:Uncharacterized protein n=1 Tax=Choiromyces venosus 120613-1 TaxID=1336337 RepID=A0A3N4JHC1_9PEZI|nr:hypothetical protein L873DRAFT_1770849 [Choiromyces venosus 120613-1]
MLKPFTPPGIVPTEIKSNHFFASNGNLQGLSACTLTPHHCDRHPHQNRLYQMPSTPPCNDPKGE